MRLSSVEALNLLKPFGFERGRDLNRVLYGELKSLNKIDVMNYIKKLKKNRLYRLYNENMTNKQIAKELLIEESMITPLLQTGILKSHSVQHVQELLDKAIEICKDRALFWKLYQLVTQRELADLCGCSIASIKAIVKKFEIVKRGKKLHAKRGYKMPEKFRHIWQVNTKRVVAINLNDLTIIKKYPSINAVERDTGVGRRTISRNASKPIELLADGTIRGAFGDIRYIFIGALKEGLRELRKLKKEECECEIYHTVERINYE